MLNQSKLGCALLAALLMFTGGALAQGAGATAGGKVAASAPSGDPIPPPLKAALEAGNQRGIDSELRKMNISVPPGTPPRHECGATQCSCAGAKGCSTIATACKEDTISCIKDSCVCTKK